MAPVLMPVTPPNCGRVPFAVQPTRNPAPKAPLLPPPEMQRKSRGTARPLSLSPYMARILSTRRFSSSA